MRIDSRHVSHDLAYILPMLIFLLITAAGNQWPGTYAAGYAIKTILAGAALILLRDHYTKISWRVWWLGILVGVIGTVQWIAMGKLMMHWKIADSSDAHSPMKVASPAFQGIYLAFRLAGPVLVVPFMEELFWRDFLWRTVVDPDDFKRAQVGHRNWLALLVVTAAFASVHASQGLTAVVWGLMIAGLLISTRSLGACILMHATTNLLLGIWVVWQHDWAFW